MWSKQTVWNENPFDSFWCRWCFHHGKTGQQKVAEQQTGTDTGQQSALTGASQGTLSQFEGPVQQSPFYKAMLNTGIESTSNAYQRARANQTQRAQQAGFGENQPVKQGADSQIDASEAQSLSQVPERAMEATAPLSLQAAQDSGAMGMKYGDQAQGWNDQAYQMQKGRAGLWNQLFQAGAGAATGLGEAALMA